MGVYQAIRGFSASEQVALRSRILQNGPYSTEENEKIYDGFFRFIPNRLSHLLSLHGLREKKVLDIGCGYGQFLLHFGEGSVGIELSPPRLEFARALGMNIIERNFEETWPELEGRTFDAVWACNVLEHTISPFLFLQKARRVLRPGGTAFIGIPTVSQNAFCRMTTKLLFGGLGYESIEHTYAFTPSTVNFLLSRTGFEVLDANVFVSSKKLINSMLKPVLPKLSSQIVIVARANDDLPKPQILPPNWFHSNL